MNQLRKNTGLVVKTTNTEALDSEILNVINNLRTRCLIHTNNVNHLPGTIDSQVKIITGTTTDDSEIITMGISHFPKGVKKILIYDNINNNLDYQQPLEKPVDFNPADYMKLNPDIISGGFNTEALAMLHWETYGKKENRAIKSPPISSPSPTKPTFDYEPLISIIMPVHNVKHTFLKEAIESVLEQQYSNLQLCIVDDKSTDPEIKIILNNYAEHDNRIKLLCCEENNGIAETTKSAISLATGEYIGFVDHDDVLAPDALLEVIRALNTYDNLKIIYTDEDKIISDGTYGGPYFKPDWNKNLFLSQNYMCHFVVINRDTYIKHGCHRKECDGAQDWDNLLHIIPNISECQIYHIPKILYHWRIHENSSAEDVGNKSNALTASQIALESYCTANKINATVERVHDHYFNIKYKLPRKKPLVTIIIPTKNNYKLLKDCVDSIQKLTTYNNYKIVIVDNNSNDPTTLKFLLKLSTTGGCEILPYDTKFDHSAMNNYAVTNYKSDLYLLLNDDTTIIDPDWLTEMVRSIQQEDVGIVGCKLLYPNDTVQHAGVILGVGAVAGHAFRFSDKDAGVMGYRLHLKQNYTAVTGACMLIKDETFKAIDGFNEKDLPTSYNDVDLCLRASQYGYKILYTPVELYHHESVSRGKELRTLESKYESYMKHKWSQYIQHDPAFNPNLNKREDFSY